MGRVEAIAVGLDVGSTTVKAVVCVIPRRCRSCGRTTSATKTRQPEMVLDFMVQIGERFPAATDVRLFITGSGSGAVGRPPGGRSSSRRSTR